MDHLLPGGPLLHVVATVELGQFLLLVLPMEVERRESEEVGREDHEPCCDQEVHRKDALLVDEAGGGEQEASHACEEPAERAWRCRHAAAGVIEAVEHRNREERKRHIHGEAVRVVPPRLRLAGILMEGARGPAQQEQVQRYGERLLGHKVA